MAKTSKHTQSVAMPRSSTLTINGQQIAGSTVNNGDTSSFYNMPANLKKAYDSAQESLAQNISKVNVFSPDVINRLNDQVKAYQAQGIKSINEIYEPMLKSAREDAAKRFGNLNNSVFMDNLNAIESKRAQAVSNLSQNIAAKRNELVNDELSRRYDYLNFLDTFQNQVYKNALSAMGVNDNTYNTGINASKSSTSSSATLPIDLEEVTALALKISSLLAV